MTDDVCSQYLRAARSAFDAIEATQLGAVREAARRFATAILAGRLVHVFGTGHSRMAVEEMFPRYGSFPGFHPIVELSMSFHQWRTLLRIQRALIELSDGASVTDTAIRLGWSNPSSFIDAFTVLVGQTPGGYRSSARSSRSTHG